MVQKKALIERAEATEKRTTTLQIGPVRLAYTFPISVR